MTIKIDEQSAYYFYGMRAGIKPLFNELFGTSSVVE